jgi:membrane fusion protein (multidrug efflux system)
MFAQATVRLEQHDNAIVVPAAALVRDDQGAAAVYVLDGDTARRTPVTTGIEERDRVEIVQGLRDGQTILTSGVHGLGDAVKIAKPE